MPDFPTAQSTLENSTRLTAAEIGAALGVSRQAINGRLRGFPPVGSTVKSGNECPTWSLAALPGGLAAELKTLSAKRGYASVAEMHRCWFKAWKPPVTLSEISEECLEDARKLKEALLPSLRKQLDFSQADFARDGIADYRNIFGHDISAKHFGRLICRTIERDGGLENWERLELYLPKKPERKRKASAPANEFPLLAQAINFCESPDSIWKKTFLILAEMAKAGEPRKRSARKLRNFLASRAPGLADTRDGLFKMFERRFERHCAMESFDKRQGNGAGDGELSAQIKALAWFIPAAKFFYLRTNRARGAGSMPEAVIRTISLPKVPIGWPEGLKKYLLRKLNRKTLPTCPPDLYETIRAREKNYQPLVPRGIAQQIIVNPSVVEFFRSPREWSLKYQSCPGSQRRYTNDAGKRVIMAPGDWFGGDDSTPGIAVCVPSQEIITPCSERYGVMLGRFQWLAYIDCRTDKILGWDYVVRPRGSYRGEDILNGMGAVMRANGRPKVGWQFEGGAWNCKLVREAISLLDCRHWRTYSPHQKAVERVFNSIWTRLAVQFPHADMGRRRNENEANCRLYEACKRGHKDPRRYFPGVDLLVKVIEEAVREHNARPIKSIYYGRWTPDDFFDDAIRQNPLRKFPAESEWILSPFAVERKVRGMMVSCRVPMFENFSVPFEFGADWLPEFHGKRVRLHFNQRDPKCKATIVLLEKCGEKKAGEMLGDAQLISSPGNHIRFILDWGSDDDRAGYVQRQRVANFVRRETRGIGAGGRVEYSKSEHREGISKIGIVERVAPAPDGQAQAARRLATNLEDAKAWTPERNAEFERKQGQYKAARAERHAELERLRKENEHLFI